MSDSRLPVAIIGVGGFGGRTLQALASIDAVRVVGVSDRDGAVAEQVARRFDVPAYCDNRSLLAETRPRAVYLATPPMVTGDLVAACAARGIHVWTESPLARSLDEGLAMVRRMDDAHLKLAVGTQRRFALGYQEAFQLRGQIAEIFLARAHYLFNWGPQLNWRGDRASAGGGALLELGYHPIDLLVWMLGLPEIVYGFSSGGVLSEDVGEVGKARAIYDTDDTAAATLRYSSGAMAVVVTTRRSGPVSEELNLHGRGGSIVANAELCLLRDADGNVLERSESDASPAEVFRRQAEAFANAVVGDAKHYACSGRENLLDLAVIEAIYLSDRTGQPESPLRLLKARELTLEECLSRRPPPPPE